MTLHSLPGSGPTPPVRPYTPAQQQEANEDLAEIAGSTAAGAAIGSFIPGVGTAIGAGIGFGIGIFNAVIDAVTDDTPPGSDFPEELPELPPVQQDAAPVIDGRTQEIAQMYRDLLGREPDAAGLEGWVNGGLSLDEVRNGIASSPEGQRVSRIKDVVNAITGRGATPEEIQWFHGRLDAGQPFETAVGSFRDLQAQNAQKAADDARKAAEEAAAQAQREAELQPITDFFRLYKEEVGADFSGDGHFMQSLADELKRGVPEQQIRERIREAAIERYASSGEPLPEGSKITPEDVITKLYSDITGGKDINTTGAGPGTLAQRYRDGVSFAEIRGMMEETQRYVKQNYGG